MTDSSVKDFVQETRGGCNWAGSITLSAYRRLDVVGAKSQSFQVLEHFASACATRRPRSAIKGDRPWTCFEAEWWWWHCIAFSRLCQTMKQCVGLYEELANRAVKHYISCSTRRWRESGGYWSRRHWQLSNVAAKLVMKLTGLGRCSRPDLMVAINLCAGHFTEVNINIRFRVCTWGSWSLCVVILGCQETTRGKSLYLESEFVSLPVALFSEAIWFSWRFLKASVWDSLKITTQCWRLLQMGYSPKLCHLSKIHHIEIASTCQAFDEPNIEV